MSENISIGKLVKEYFKQDPVFCNEVWPKHRPADITALTDCAERELRMRRSVFPKRVKMGAMTTLEMKNETCRMAALLFLLDEIDQNPELAEIKAQLTKLLLT